MLFYSAEFYWVPPVSPNILLKVPATEFEKNVINLNCFLAFAHMLILFYFSGSQIDILRALGLQSPLVSNNAQRVAASPVSAADAELVLGGEQFYDKQWNSINSLFTSANNDPYSIERAAKLYRNAACKSNIFLHFYSLHIISDFYKAEKRRLKSLVIS